MHLIQHLSVNHVLHANLIDSSHPGFYCPNGTIEADQYPCPPGTYSGAIDLWAAEQCDACPEGYYCSWATSECTPTSQLNHLNNCFSNPTHSLQLTLLGQTLPSHVSLVTTAPPRHLLRIGTHVQRVPTHLQPISVLLSSVPSALLANTA